MRDYCRNLMVEYLSNCLSDRILVWNLGKGDKKKVLKTLNEDITWKTTSKLNGGISQKLLVRSNPTLNLILREPNKIIRKYSIKMTFNGILSKGKPKDKGTLQNLQNTWNLDLN